MSIDLLCNTSILRKTLPLFYCIAPGNTDHFKSQLFQRHANNSITGLSFFSSEIRMAGIKLNFDRKKGKRKRERSKKAYCKNMKWFGRTCRLIVRFSMVTKLIPRARGCEECQNYIVYCRVKGYTVHKW